MWKRLGAEGLTVVLLAAAVSAVLLSLGGASATPASGFPVHCNATVRGENAADNAVQTAVNAATPGQTVCVRAGIYPEQISIDKALRLVGQGPTRTIFAPNSLVFNTVDWDSAAPSNSAGLVPCGSDYCVPLAAIILVENSTSGPTVPVEIQGVGVNGTPGSASVACGDDYVGVDFQDSSGTLTAASVVNVASPIGSFGCQEVSGAIYAYNGYFYTKVVPTPVVTVVVSHTTVTGYQKNGITCDDYGEACVLTADTVVGIGPTTLTAQNGIQVAYGAAGTLLRDRVSGNDYTGTDTTLDWYGTGWQATGILLYQAAAATSVTHCHLTGNAMGIVGDDDSSDWIASNTVSDSAGYAIVEDGASGTEATIVTNTIINHQDQAVGILVDNGTFTVVDNSIAWVSSSGTQGASQAVAGTGTIFPGGAAASIMTAAIQAVSEGGPTIVTDTGNHYAHVSDRLATLEVFSGTVTVTT